MRSFSNVPGRWYAGIVTVVAVLGTWNTLATYLDLPGPRVVSQRIEEVFTERADITSYGFEFSAYSRVAASSPLPLPTSCTETATLRVRQPAVRMEVGRWPREVLLPSYFVHSDIDMTWTAPGTPPEQFVTHTSRSAPTAGLSFYVEYPGRGQGVVVLDELEFVTSRVSDVALNDFDLEISWNRSLVVQPAPLPVLNLSIRIPEIDGITSALNDRRSAKLGFELRPGERLQVSLSMSFERPGLYALSPVVVGYESGGRQFRKELGERLIGWDLLSKATFRLRLPSKDFRFCF